MDVAVTKAQTMEEECERSVIFENKPRQILAKFQNRQREKPSGQPQPEDTANAASDSPDT